MGDTQTSSTQPVFTNDFACIGQSVIKPSLSMWHGIPGASGIEDECI